MVAVVADEGRLVAAEVEVAEVALVEEAEDEGDVEVLRVEGGGDSAAQDSVVEEVEEEEVVVEVDSRKLKLRNKCTQ